NIEQPLVRAHLELFATFLVDMGRTVDGEFLDPRRQRNRTPHLRAGALGGRYDLARRGIEDAVIERLEPDAYVLAVHVFSDSAKPPRSGQQRRTRDPAARVCVACPVTGPIYPLIP